MKHVCNKRIICAATAVLCTMMAVTPAYAATGILTGDSVNMRSSASTDGSIIDCLSLNQEVEILGYSNGWYNIKVNGLTGWAYGKYIKEVQTPVVSEPVSTATPAPAVSTEPTAEPAGETGKTSIDISKCVCKTATVTGNDVNIRAGAGTQHEVLFTVSSGTECKIFDVTGTWYLVYCDGKFGFVDKSLTSEPNGQKYMVTASSLNLRASAVTGEVITVLPKYTVVMSFKNANGWYEALTFDNKSGWLSGEYITPYTESGLSNPTIPSSVLSVTTSRGTSSFVINNGDYSEASQTRTAIVNLVNSLKGTPYYYGGTSTSGFDCSGLVYYVYQNAANMKIERVAADQAKGGIKVTVSELQPGDMVFFDTNGTSSYINHAGIYIGNGQFTHASSGKGAVITSDLTSGYYARCFMTARRYL